MPPFPTIDTLSHLVATTLLNPFIYFLLALTSAATANSRSTTSVFALKHLTYHISLPNFPTTCLILTFLLLGLRFFAALDARVAQGPRRKINWEDEVVLITGGLGGLGGLIAEVYGMRGVPVAVLDVRGLSGEEEKELEEKGVRYWRCDVGDREAVERAVKSVREELGHPTILIHTAALTAGSPILSLSSDILQKLYNTNLLSHHHLTQLLLPHMLSRPTGGHIVTVSSVLGYTGCAGLGAYTGSKAALTALHASLTAELGIMARRASSSSPAGAPSEGDGGKPLQQYPGAVKTLLVTPGQLSTPLFASIKPPSTFFGPTVQVNELAAAIVKKIDKGEGGEVSLPLYARWIGTLRLLPPGMGKLTRGMAGLDGAGWAAFGGQAEGKRVRMMSDN